jgi:hypothetical protein
MTRFPNLTEQEKDRLLKLFLVSGTLRVHSDTKYSFEAFEHGLISELDAEDGKLILKAMNDLYSPV